MNNTEENIKTPQDEAVDEQQEAPDEKEQEVSLYDEMEAEKLRVLLNERDEQIDALNEELEQTQDSRMRKAAELENYRKRVKRERSKIYDSAKANALEDFLSISDDLTRTLEASEELDVNQEFLEGVTLVADKFDEVLKKHGVQRIDETGVPFDVDMHDALMSQKPEDENVASDTVLSIIENGYKIGDRTIRHAKVIVSE